MSDEKEPVYPCSICGRNFIQQSLSKHETACQKLQKLHRKVFDSGKQRAKNSDVPLADIRKAQKEKTKNGGIFPRPKTHWRERHEEFISAVSASKNVKVALKTGAPLPPPPSSIYSSDSVKCNYCGRTFNERVVERHISFCREQDARKVRVYADSIANLKTSKRSSSTSRISSHSTYSINLINGHDLNSLQSNKTAKKLPANSLSTSTTNRANRPSSRFSSHEHAMHIPQQTSTGKKITTVRRNSSISRGGGCDSDSAKITLGGAFVYINDRNDLASKTNAITQKNATSHSSIKSRTSSQSRLKTPKPASTIRR